MANLSDALTPPIDLEQVSAALYPIIAAGIGRKGFDLHSDTVKVLVQNTMGGIIRRKDWQKLPEISPKDAEQRLLSMVRYEIMEQVRQFASHENIPRYAYAGKSTKSKAVVEMAQKHNLPVAAAAYMMTTELYTTHETETVNKIDDSLLFEYINDLCLLESCMFFIKDSSKYRLMILNITQLAEELTSIVKNEVTKKSHAHLLALMRLNPATLPYPLRQIVELLSSMKNASHN